MIIGTVAVLVAVLGLMVGLPKLVAVIEKSQEK
jgi:hypothetical protein